MIHFTSLQEKIKEHKSPSNASSHSFLVVTKNGLFFFLPKDKTIKVIY